MTLMTAPELALDSYMARSINSSTQQMMKALKTPV